jgi:pantoate--beta-alanine ligase
MEIIQKINQLKTLLAGERKQGKTIGLVPTMGALHDGHLSLVGQCRKDNEVCVISIFVNPTQFIDIKDFHTYPRMFEKDCEMLQTFGCDYIFAPSEKEMYPEPDTRVFNLGPVAEVMEGRMRPGHFNGVAQIVSKLFDIIAPDNAYFGEKDFQQIAVIREMVRRYHLAVNIIACPIVREKDGLAMSSRNVRLTAGQREIAPAIARTLEESRTLATAKSVKETAEWVINTLNRIPPLRVEYFEIIDGNTLQPIRNWDETTNPTGCITVFCGDVRLIDNIKYEHLK